LARASSSIRFKGVKTASRPGLLFIEGDPIAIAQITGGSAQPSQGETQRVFPIKAPDTESRAAAT